MTQPVNARLMADYQPIDRSSNASFLQITLLATAILSSLFTMMILPWDMSIPIGTVLLSSVVLFSFLRFDDDSPMIYHQLPPPPVLFEHRHFPLLPPLVIDDRPRIYEPYWKPNPPSVPIHVDTRPRAPVGVRTNASSSGFGDIFAMRSERPTPPAPEGWSSAQRAPVGARIETSESSFGINTSFSMGSDSPPPPSVPGGWSSSAPRAPVGHR